VTLRWDNSWRDDFNWDAAWVFFKYKKRGLENPWQHAYLSSSGHVLSTAAGNEGGGYAYMVGANAGKVNGLYVMRNGISEGNVSVRLQAKWPLNGTGLTKSDFGNALNEIYVAVHAIEMVYIPYNSYYLGDASSYKSFAVGDTAAILIDSENTLKLSAKNGMPNVSLAASYPKGYAGFYVMKYETSQEQYVEFLNSLTLDQQKARVANNKFSTMKRGDYVFGDLKTPSNRNGIVFVEQRTPTAPVVFGNNLNPANDLFSTDDGQTLACNYMSIEDMIAYCSWSGLRPMSELEYEKACRRPYPQLPEAGEYAWNSNTGVNSLNGLSDLAYLGDEREVANNASRNVNGGTNNRLSGPVRCGMFATSSTSQLQSGGTYWGVMDMSGNLKELCVNVNYTNFDGAGCGAGVYNANLWDKTVNRYGVRGGGFTSVDSLLRTSDRTEAMNYFTAITQRDSTVGFRGVYNLSGIAIDGGKIRVSKDTLCPGDEANIINVAEASCPDLPDVRFQYTWYVKKPGEAQYILIENATGKDLTYDGLENTTTNTVTYQFKRTGICAMGETFTTVSVILSAPIQIIKQPYDTDRSCDFFILRVEARGENTISYQWQKEGSDIAGATSSTYMKSPTSSADVAGYRCQIKSGSCITYSEVAKVANVSDVNTLTDTRDGKTYPIIKIGEQCWMGKNLNYGVINSTKYCYNNTESNCDQYGGMYTWYMAMNNAPASPVGVQGICPQEWHIPSYSEWEDLRQNWNTVWNLQRGGHRIASQGRFRGLGTTGGWWATQWDRYGGISSGGDAPYHWYDYAYGIVKGANDWNSVRCIKTK
ncbi:MAG: SUMF1/EgtB/PvdO family nonheme iron enzyme, partial [Oscillibacter sp.]|nr:SUMF1/EgtB/PvdO family nonheme iron enzyme [Oscillibacter sp.]